MFSVKNENCQRAMRPNFVTMTVPVLINVLHVMTNSHLVRFADAANHILEGR